MSRCPQMDACPIFPLFKARRSLRAWQSTYCEADYTACARYERSLEGKTSPLNLLPNGEMLVVREDVAKP